MSNAKLQEDTKQEEKKLNSLSEKLQTQTQRFEALRDALLQETQRLNEASQKLKYAEDGQKKAKIAASQANEKLNIELSNLDIARWKIVMTNFSQRAYMSRLIDDKLSDVLYKQSSDSDSFILDADNAWPQILTSIRSALSAARQSAKEIPKNYFDKIEKHINEHANQLACPKPDFPALAKQFNHEMKNIDSLASVDAAAEIERQRKEAENDGGSLLVKKGDLEQLKIGYKISKTYVLKAKYIKTIEEKGDICADIVHNYIKTIKSDLNIPTNTD